MYSEYYNSQANKAVPADPKDKPYYTPLNGDEAIAKTPASNDPNITASEKLADRKHEQYSLANQLIDGTLIADSEGASSVGIMINPVLLMKRLDEIADNKHEQDQKFIQQVLWELGQWLDQMERQIRQLLNDIEQLQKDIIEKERNIAAYRSALNVDDLSEIQDPDERRRVEKCIKDYEAKHKTKVTTKAQRDEIIQTAMNEDQIDLIGQRNELKKKQDEYEDKMAEMNRSIAKGNEAGSDLVKARADRQALNDRAQDILGSGIKPLGDDAEMESFERFLGELKQQDLPEHDMADYIGRYAKNMSDTAQDEIKARDDMKQYFQASQPDDAPEPPEPDTPQPPPISLSALPSF